MELAELYKQYGEAQIRLKLLNVQINATPLALDLVATDKKIKELEGLIVEALKQPKEPPKDPIDPIKKD